MEFIVATTVSDGKNANGEFVGQKVGRDQYKADALIWHRLSAEVWAEMLQEFERFVVIARIPDMVHNSWLTIRMYPGNRSATPAEINPITGLPSMYHNCKVNLVDCGVIE